jgi:secreted PhoX family phosphatase
MKAPDVNRISRRAFLKGAATAGAGAVLVGCVAPSAAPSAAESAAPQAAAPQEVRMGHWWGEKFDQLIPMVQERYNVHSE